MQVKGQAEAHYERTLLERCGFPWSMGMTFNTILYPSDMLGTRHNYGCIREFEDLIAELMLVDLPFIGGLYTWTNNRE